MDPSTIIPLSGIVPALQSTVNTAEKDGQRIVLFFEAFAEKAEQIVTGAPDQVVPYGGAVYAIVAEFIARGVHVAADWESYLFTDPFTGERQDVRAYDAAWGSVGAAPGPKWTAFVEAMG
jgi:hypothetical protein